MNAGKHNKNDGISLATITEFQLTFFFFVSLFQRSNFSSLIPETKKFAKWQRLQRYKFVSLMVVLINNNSRSLNLFRICLHGLHLIKRFVCKSEILIEFWMLNLYLWNSMIIVQMWRFCNLLLFSWLSRIRWKIHCLIVDWCLRPKHHSYLLYYRNFQSKKILFSFIILKRNKDKQTCKHANIQT